MNVPDLQNKSAPKGQSQLGYRSLQVDPNSFPGVIYPMQLRDHKEPWEEHRLWSQTDLDWDHSFVAVSNLPLKFFVSLSKNCKNISRENYRNYATSYHILQQTDLVFFQTTVKVSGLHCIWFSSIHRLLLSKSLWPGESRSQTGLLWVIHQSLNQYLELLQWNLSD